jgi:tetratricopeptide (TPR) repeat protein
VKIYKFGKLDSIMANEYPGKLTPRKRVSGEMKEAVERARRLAGEPVTGIGYAGELRYSPHSNATQYLEEAEILRRAGRYDESIEALRHASRNVRSLKESEQGKYQNAINRRAMRVHLAQVDELISTKDYSEAIRTLEGFSTGPRYLEGKEKEIYEEAIEKRARKIIGDAKKRKDGTRSNYALRATSIIKRIEAERNQLGRRSKLESSVMHLAAVGIFGGMLLLSMNLTGNVISSAALKTANIFGAGLFVAAIVCGAIYFWKRK